MFDLPTYIAQGAKHQTVPLEAFAKRTAVPVMGPALNIDPRGPHRLCSAGKLRLDQDLLECSLA